MNAEIADSTTVGFCVDDQCWSLNPVYVSDDNPITFTSFTAAKPCFPVPFQFPDIEALASDSQCVMNDGTFSGTGFKDCWAFNVLSMNSSSTTIQVWKW